MKENQSVITVKTGDGFHFENTCDHFISLGYGLRFSGHNGAEWWAVLIKPVKRPRKHAEVANHDD